MRGYMRTKNRLKLNSYLNQKHKINLNDKKEASRSDQDLKSKVKKLNFNYRTLNLGSLKMFFTIENNELVYKFI